MVLQQRVRLSARQKDSTDLGNMFAKPMDAEKRYLPGETRQSKIMGQINLPAVLLVAELPFSTNTLVSLVFHHNSKFTS